MLIKLLALARALIAQLILTLLILFIGSCFKPLKIDPSGEICTCATWAKPLLSNAHLDKLISLLLLNLKMSITKVTGVSFEYTKNYIQENLKMMLLSIRSSWKLQLNYKWHDFFNLCTFSKLVPSIISYFAKLKPLKN